MKSKDNLPLFNLKRTYFKDATLGLMWLEGEENPVWSTIELPWLNNKENKSCIPEGTYLVEPYRSEKFKSHPNVWRVCDVLDREHVSIHVANMTEELKGCIAIGLSSGYMREPMTGKKVKAVTNSAMALREIKQVIDYSKPFKLKIWS